MLSVKSNLLLATLNNMMRVLNAKGRKGYSHQPRLTRVILLAGVECEQVQWGGGCI